jgi:transposase
MTTTRSLEFATPEVPRVWAGCDVAKETFDAALWFPLDAHEQRPMKDIPVATFPRTPEGVSQLLTWADDLLASEDEPSGLAPTLRVVMEATGRYSIDLAVWMIAQRPSHAPAIINPQTAHHYIDSLAVRNKTDATAARALARFGAERRPVSYEPPTPELALVQALVRRREDLTTLRVAEENRAEELADAPAVIRRQIRRHIAQLRRDEAMIERELRKAVDAVPAFKQDVDRLQTIYGVGFLTAAIVLAELGDLRRFEKARQLSAFAGLSPRRVESGTSVHKRSRLCKKGSSRLRKALYMPALSALRGDNDFADFYRQLVGAGKPKMVALGAVMRKMLLTMRAVLIHNTPYQPHYRKPAPFPCG